MALSVHFEQQLENPGYPLPADGRRKYEGNEFEERRLLVCFFLELCGGVVLFFLQIPLVHDHDQTASTLPRQRRDLQILVVETLCSVQHQNTDVRSIDRAPRSERRVEFNSLFDLRLTSEPRGIDKDYFASVKHHRSVDRVARRSRGIGNNESLLAEQSVDEGGFADIGTPDYRNAERIRHFFGSGWNSLHEHVEHVAGVLAVECGHRNRIACTQLVELEVLRRRWIVDFVGDQYPRLA